jgi:hypothetical protein
MSKLAEKKGKRQKAKGKIEIRQSRRKFLVNKTLSNLLFSLLTFRFCLFTCAF